MMNHPITILHWAAWASEIETKADWLDWAKNPLIPKTQGQPKLAFVPAMQRRRISKLGKMALQVAFDCLEQEQQTQIPTVFATRHGEMETTLKLLHDLLNQEGVSPTGFSHSVHNTASGHFSILANNPAASITLAAGKESFMAGMLESLSLSQRLKSDRVLLVMMDDRLPESLHDQCSDPAFAYALGLLIAPSQSKTNLTMKQLQPSTTTAQPNQDLPQALEFLQWMLQGQEDMIQSLGAMQVQWSKHG